MAYKTIRNRLQQFVRESAERVSVTESGPLWVDVSCFNKYPDQWEEKDVPKDESQVLKYRVLRESDSVRIEPDLPYLKYIRKEEPVWSLRYMWMPFRWLPVTLDLKLLNRGDEPLYLTQLELLVERSAPDNEPVLFVKRDNAFPCLYIHNEGWGHIEKASLRLAFADGDGEPDFPNEFPFPVEVTQFEDEGTELDLSDLFAQQGVDVDAVMQHDESAALGAFPSGRAYVFGELTVDVAGVGRRVLRFGTEIAIQGPMYGMYGPPTFEYQAKLLAEGKNYVVPIEISQVIGPGESDRVLVQLDADKSSHHRMSLCFRGSGQDVVVGTPVEITVFVPRSVAEHLREPETDQPRFQ